MSIRRCFALAVVALLAASNASQFGKADEKDDLIKKDVAALQGTWEMVSGERGSGEAFPDTFADNFKLFFDGNKLTISMAGKDLKTTYTIDPTQKIKHIDITTNEGGVKVVSPGIYSVEKDTLKFVLDEKDKVRAPSFIPEKGSAHMSFVFKRKKAKD